MLQWYLSAENNGSFDLVHCSSYIWTPSCALLYLYVTIAKITQALSQTSRMVQKYLPARSFGEAQVSRSSSLVSLRSQTSSQLQCRGFPPKLKTSAVRGEPFILAYTGIRRNSGSGGIFFSLLEVMSSLEMETETWGEGSVSNFHLILRQRVE